MTANPMELGLIALSITWAFDYLFWEKPPGISFAILVALTLTGGLFLAWRNGKRPASGSLGLLLPVGFFSVMSFIREEPLTQFLNYGLSFGLLGLLANTFTGGRWFAYSLSDYLRGLAELIASAVIRPLGLLANGRQGRTDNTPSRTRARRWIPALRGILLAVPFLVLFSALLSAADPIFSRAFEAFLAWFQIDNLPEFLFRVFYILVLAYCLAGLYLHALTLSQDEHLIGVEKPWLKPFLGVTEAAIVVGAVDLLFSAFVAFQFRYFFGGQVTLEAQGLTYAEYARRGFAELVAVSVISFFLLWGLSNLTSRDKRRARRVFSGLGLGLVLLLLVILGSAYQRLLLYEGAFGFTRLRTYTHVFMAWLGVLLVLVIGLEVGRRQRAFALAALGVTVGFGVTLNLLNVDVFIVQKNIARAYAGSELDINYLQTLSLDAGPALARAYDQAQTTDEAFGSAALADEIAQAFACHANQHNRYTADLPWPSFHLARENARRAWLDHAEYLPLDLETNCPQNQWDTDW
jgi:hypothetical protein